MPVETGILPPALMKNLLGSSLWGLETLVTSRVLDLPAAHRLAFRELGLAIGLHAASKIVELIEQEPNAFSDHPTVIPQLSGLTRFFPLGAAIEQFWLDPRHQQTRTWKAHLDINQVMLATCLIPDGYLEKRRK